MLQVFWHVLIVLVFPLVRKNYREFIKFSMLLTWDSMFSRLMVFSLCLWRRAFLRFLILANGTLIVLALSELVCNLLRKIIFVSLLLIINVILFNSSVITWLELILLKSVWSILTWGFGRIIAWDRHSIGFLVENLLILALQHLDLLLYLHQMLILIQNRCKVNLPKLICLHSRWLSSIFFNWGALIHLICHIKAIVKIIM